MVYDLIYNFVERRGLWKYNPCDAWAHDRIKWLGKFFTLLGSDCRCCSGARVLTALALGVFIGAKL